MAATDREKERHELLQSLQMLNKQQVDALYRLADLETQELAEIRRIATRIRENAERLGNHHQLAKRALKALDRALDYLVLNLPPEQAAEVKGIRNTGI